MDGINRLSSQGTSFIQQHNSSIRLDLGENGTIFLISTTLSSIVLKLHNLCTTAAYFLKIMEIGRQNLKRKTCLKQRFFE